AALVIEHPSDRKVGLAGICRPEDRDEPRFGTQHGHAACIGSEGPAGKSKQLKKRVLRHSGSPQMAAANRIFTIIALPVRELGSAEKTNDERRPTKQKRIAAGDLLFPARHAARPAGHWFSLRECQAKRGGCC